MMGNSNACFILKCFIWILFLQQGFSQSTVRRWPLSCGDRSSEWRYLGGDFCYFVEMNTTVNWMDAVYDCYTKGGSLASFASKEEVSRILRYAKNYDQPLHIGLWKQSDGSFAWIDGNQMRLQNWEIESDNRHHNTCVALNTISGKWNDIKCWKRYGYVCSSLRAVPEVYPHQTTKVCPTSNAEWRDFGGNYCYIIVKTKETWPKAQSECSKLGGSLASFHSINEISVVLQYHKEFLWQYNEVLHIGLQQGEGGKFEWVDGSTMDYENWNVGKPSNPEERCGELLPIFGKWNDISCETNSEYVCSVQKVATVGAASDSETPSKRFRANIIEMRTVLADVGSNITLTCIISGVPASTFLFWFHDGSIIEDDSSRRRIITVDRGQLTYSITSTLNIIEAELNDQGNYTCFPFNAKPASTTVYVQEAFSCNGNIEAESGVIHSPNYPDNYGPYQRCFWKISVPRNFRVALNFEKVQVEYSDNCKYESIQIFDGHSRKSGLLSRLCGSQIPETLLSTENKMAINFVSSDFGNFQGFLAYFFKVDRCGGNISDEGSILQSRSYPEYYWPNDACTWKIKVPKNNAVVLKFQTFELELSDKCRSDYVEVLDGHDSTSPVIARYCGFDTPSEIRSSGNKMMVKFISDHSFEYSGFSAKVEKGNISSSKAFIPQTDSTCGGYIIAESGIILTPNYPKSYFPWLKCAWRITMPDEYQVVLRFKTFFLEGDGDQCKHDYVIIRDGLDSNSTVLGRHCRNDNPGTLISSENVMSVEFVSNDDWEFRGFAAAFSKGNITNSLKQFELEADDKHWENLISEEGNISSPNYPNVYESNRRHAWHITVTESNQVLLTFLSFEMEGHNECSYDYVKILDGENLNSPVIGKLCGQDVPNEIRSSGNNITIMFKSDSSVEYRGFFATFKAVPAVLVLQEPKEICEEDITSDEGILQSPNYPGFYPASEECIWKITVLEGKRVDLQFDSFDLEEDKGCTYDSVTVLDGDKPDSPVLGKFCGENNPGFFRSSSNMIAVKLITDDSLERPGFTATFASHICEEDIVSGSGTLQSPNYPDNYPELEECIWRITVPRGKQVVLDFDSFDLENSWECQADFVAVIDGHQTGSPVIGKFCGNENPGIFRSSKNKMTVKFVTDRGQEKPGFHATFKNDICGEDIIADSGVISSPVYKDRRHSELCRWKITVEESHRIYFEIRYLKLKKPGVCKYNALKIYEGHGSNSTLVRTFCGAEDQVTFHSNGNIITVKFASKTMDSAQGFSAAFGKDDSESASVYDTIRAIP